MNPRIENSMSRIAEKARARFQSVIKNARSQTEKAADRVVDGKKPVKTLSKLSLKLTAVSYRTTDKVLKQQTKMIEHQIDAFAGRLSAAAEASNIRNLVTTQIRMIPENASLFVNDTRDALGIVAGAGAEVGKLLKGTALELKGGNTAPQKPAATKPAARKTTRKKKVAAPKVETKPAADEPKAA